MRTNFYICRGNRDKYFDWRLKTVKFRSTQKLARAKSPDQISLTRRENLVVMFRTIFTFRDGGWEHIGDANWISLDINFRDIFPSFVVSTEQRRKLRGKFPHICRGKSMQT